MTKHGEPSRFRHEQKKPGIKARMRRMRQGMEEGGFVVLGIIVIVAGMSAYLGTRGNDADEAPAEDCVVTETETCDDGGDRDDDG